MKHTTRGDTYTVTALPLPVSPLSFCILNLDIDTLEQMLSVIPHNLADEREAFIVALVHDVGLQLMGSKPTFGAMFETGSKYRTNLKRILETVVMLKRTGPFWMKTSSTSTKSLTPLEASSALLGHAFFVDRTDLMEMLFVIEPNASLKMETNKANKRHLHMLEELVLRQNFRAVDMLTRRGADLLKPVGMGDTILSRMAREVPPMLSNALDYLETLPTRARGMKFVKEILEVPQLDAAEIFDLIVLNGVYFIIG